MAEFLPWRARFMAWEKKKNKCSCSGTFWSGIQNSYLIWVNLLPSTSPLLRTIAHFFQRHVMETKSASGIPGTVSDARSFVWASVHSTIFAHWHLRGTVAILPCP